MKLAVHSDQNNGGVDDALNRFSYPARDKLFACANLSPRVAQLAQTHPVLFAFLAGKCGSARERKFAFRKAVEGSSLADVCASVGLPVAFRDIPPEAVVRRLAAVNWSKNASRELRSLIPGKQDAACRWLYAVTHAHRLGGERFALWVARQRDLLELKQFSNHWLVPLAAFAWHSEQPDSPLAPLPQKKWNKQNSLLATIERAGVWLMLLRTISTMGLSGLGDTWLEGGAQNGFTITPIRTGRELIDESVSMRNCLHGYSGCLARGSCRLFSVRHNGTPVANFEVRASPGLDKFCVTEIKGPSNRSTSLHVVVAIHQWLDQQGHRFPPRDWEYSRVAELDDEHEPDDLFAAFREAREITARSITSRLTVCSFDLSLHRLRSEVLRARGRAAIRSSMRRLCSRALRA